MRTAMVLLEPGDSRGGGQDDGFASDPFDDSPIPMDELEDEIDPSKVRPVHRTPRKEAAPAEADNHTPMIRAFEQKLDGSRHEDSWQRTPNTTGRGAIHVKSFHCKLTGESLEYLDRQINEWLDAHPQYEVKFVSTGIGTWTAKVKEPHLIVQVWV